MRVELPIISFICTVLVLIPLPWHWRARNVATVSIIVWLTICNVTRGINAIVWGGSTVVKYHVWCDITTKLIIGAYIAVPASMMCVCRYLSQVASPRQTIANASDKRRRMIFELVMCVGLPIIGMALHFVVQGHRFDIMEDFGPSATIYVSVPALFLVFLPPLVLSTGTFVYAGIAIAWFVRRRAQFRAVLQSSQSGLTTAHYVRLIALSVTEMVYMTFMCGFILFVNVQEYGMRPWVSWDFVHAEWYDVPQFAKVLVPQYFWNNFIAVWYIIPLTSVIFFTFFGFGREANAEYRKWFQWIQTRVFRMKPKVDPMLPTFARGGIRTNKSVMANAVALKSQTETTLSEFEKSGDILASSNVSTISRPSSPPHYQGDGTLHVPARS